MIKETLPVETDIASQDDGESFGPSDIITQWGIEAGKIFVKTLKIHTELSIENWHPHPSLKHQILVAFGAAGAVLALQLTRHQLMYEITLRHKIAFLNDKTVDCDVQQCSLDVYDKRQKALIIDLVKSCLPLIPPPSTLATAADDLLFDMGCTPPARHKHNLAVSDTANVRFLVDRKLDQQ